VTVSDDPPTTFDSPVEARAYAMAIALAQSQGGGWELVQPHLATAIQARPDASYAESLLDAIESLASLPT
jgi:hypothetical protein